MQWVTNGCAGRVFETGAEPQERTNGSGLRSGFKTPSTTAGTPSSGTNATTPLRRVILFSEEGKPNVAMMRDGNAFKILAEAIVTPSNETQAQFKAAQLDGRIFLVQAGTKAEVLEEIPTPKAPNLTISLVRISNGPHANETAFCFASDTQRDRSL